MTDSQRYFCLSEMPHYTDRDAYISDLALSSVFEADSEDISAALIQDLGQLWDAAHRSVKDICRDAGLSQREVARKFLIPYRTMENWGAESRECPIYVKFLMQIALGLL